MGGTFETAECGTFETDMPGTFHSATGGTFVPVMGGTFNPLLSQNPEINGELTFAEYEQRVGKNKLIYYPFSRKVASHTMGYITEHKVNGNLKVPELLPYQESEWNRIGKEIATWGYAKLAEAVS